MILKIVVQAVFVFSSICAAVGCSNRPSATSSHSPGNLDVKPAHSGSGDPATAPSGTQPHAPKKLAIAVDNGNPLFSVVYSEMSDSIWVLSFTINAADAVPNRRIKSVAWRLWDTNSQSAITDWTIGEDHPSDVIYVGNAVWEWTVSDPQMVHRAISEASALRLELSINGDLHQISATHFIDLGGYWATNPRHFRSIDDEPIGYTIAH